jgi:hypothetical protein
VYSSNILFDFFDCFMVVMIPSGACLAILLQFAELYFEGLVLVSANYFLDNRIDLNGVSMLLGVRGALNKFIILWH